MQSLDRIVLRGLDIGDVQNPQATESGQSLGALSCAQQERHFLHLDDH
jgi:hypothetical protein